MNIREIAGEVGTALFAFEQIQNTIRVPVRPLCALSDFVVEQFPQRLGAVREGREPLETLVDDLRALLTPISFERLSRDKKAWDIALLDLKIVEVGLAHTARLLEENVVLPAKLISLINFLSLELEQPTTLTYEEIVLCNPQEDYRCFTFAHSDACTTSSLTAIQSNIHENTSTRSPTLLHERLPLFPEDGRKDQSSVCSEAEFYRAHQFIEEKMDDVLLQIHAAIGILHSEGSAGVKEACIFLQIAEEYLAQVQDYTKTTGKQMRNRDFLLFREYLKSHPARGGPGASGAFSATFPTLDLLIAGEKLSEEDL